MTLPLKTALDSWRDSFGGDGGTQEQALTVAALLMNKLAAMNKKVSFFIRGKFIEIEFSRALLL